VNTNTQEYRKGTFASIFRRKGGPGEHTKLFEEFSLETQKQISDSFSISKDELPVLASLPTQNDAILLTTRRLHVRDASGHRKFEVSDIILVKPVEFAKVRKESMKLIAIQARNNQEALLRVEEGRPFFGILSILMNIVHRNASAKSLLESSEFGPSVH